MVCPEAGSVETNSATVTTRTPGTRPVYRPSTTSVLVVVLPRVAEVARWRRTIRPDPQRRASNRPNVRACPLGAPCHDDLGIDEGAAAALAPAGDPPNSALGPKRGVILCVLDRVEIVSVGCAVAREPGIPVNVRSPLCWRTGVGVMPAFRARSGSDMDAGGSGDGQLRSLLKAGRYVLARK